MGIYARHNDEWYRVDESADDGDAAGVPLGWATVTGVSGTVTQIPHTDDDGNEWISFRYGDDGTISTSDGYLDVLVVGGGGGGASADGNNRAAGGGGGVRWGLHKFTELAGRQISVGKGSVGYTSGKHKCDDGGESRIDNVLHAGGGGGAEGRYNSYPSGAGNAGGGGGRGYFSGLTNSKANGGGSDTGTKGMVLNYENADKEYGAGGAGSAGQGGGGYQNPTNQNGVNGVVVIKVPARNVADGVRINAHGWNRYAKVTDGVVTEVVQQPENEARTLDAEWIDAPDNVQSGWVYVDGELQPPPPPPEPTRDELIAELEARIVELQKDTMIIDGRETKIKRNRKRK